jgi:hypothetical protein
MQSNPLTARHLLSKRAVLKQIPISGAPWPGVSLPAPSRARCALASAVSRGFNRKFPIGWQNAWKSAAALGSPSPPLTPKSSGRGR